MDDFYDRLIDIIDGYKVHGKTSHALDQIDALYAEQGKAEVERLRAERSEIRAALIRELRESRRRRLAWQSARRGRVRAREEARFLRRAALRDRLAANGAIDHIERLTGERDQAEAHVGKFATQAAQLRGLVAEALHLRVNGERAPGGTETWREWDRTAETVLRGIDTGESIETRVHAVFADADEKGVSLDAMTTAELTAFVMAAITGQDPA